jgi:hypothetical protein
MRFAMMIVVVAVVLAGPAWARPMKSAEISRDARWLIHLDVERLRQAEVGRYLLAKLTTEDANNKFAAFMAVFNFDPRKDLTGITAYGESNQPERAAAIFTGNFDTQRLTTLLKAMDSYKRETYGALAIHSWLDDSKGAGSRQYGCIHPSGRIVVGRGLPYVKKALDVLEGKKAALGSNSVLRVRAPADSMVVVAAVPTDNVIETDMADMLELAQYVQFSVQDAGGKLNGDLALTAEDEAAAVNLFAVAQGFIAMAKLSRNQDPEMAKLAQGMTVSADGTDVHVEMTLTVDQVASLLDAQIAKAKAARAAVTNAPAASAGR